MEYIKGFTFVPFCPKGVLGTEESRQSLRKMKESTGCNMVIFAPNGLQETANSENIDFQSDYTCEDSELCGIIEYAKRIGLKVGLKPTANCKNGTWRAHINFFDEDVPCEPKWKNWFASYTAFQLHYAKIAQDMQCDMFIAGCEMVMAERREKEWRQLIADIKDVYSGPVSYNTDKYQEHNVKWWDCVDVISSSGYYPIDDWTNQLARIEKVVNEYKKPFFFAELGCMSVEGSQNVPNDWNMQGDVNQEIQADWMRTMFEALEKNTWVRGLAIWSWNQKLNGPGQEKGYEIYGKKAEKVVKEYFEHL